jgi:hypothetical protein
VNKEKRRRTGVLAPTPQLSLLEVSKRHYYYYYFGPGHFGWLLSLSHGFALPLKCPEFPACGLSAKAAAAPPKDIDSASISAVINNVIRLFIFSPPFAHSPQHHRPKERRMEGRHTLKPHPFCYLRGGALSLGLPLS